MVVFKKVRMLKDGNVYPLFIDNKKPFVFGEWMHSEFHPTKGFAERSLGVDEKGNQLGGWHCCYKPLAPHIADQTKAGEKRVWMMCEAKGVNAKYDRPESQGGSWCLTEWLKPIRLVDESEIDFILNN